MARKKLKVILMDDVPGLGLKYDVEEVAMGYFRNYLLPEELARPATDKALEKLEEMKSKIKKERKERIKELEEAANELEGYVVRFEKKISEGERLYGSVSEDDIATKLKEGGFENFVVALPEPIKTVGTFEAEADFGEGISANLEVLVKSIGKAEVDYLDEFDEKDEGVDEKAEEEEEGEKDIEEPEEEAEANNDEGTK